MQSRENRDMEPSIAQMLNDALTLRQQPEYRVRSLTEVEASLNAFLQGRELDQPVVSGLQRMGGGASKEQFVFDLKVAGKEAERCVLRMDPLESAVVTSRAREKAILDIMQDVLPVPRAMWCDEDGSQLGRPALITSFVGGVTKPSVSTSNVSGFGTVFDEQTREALSKPFMQHLVAMHNVDWSQHVHDCFQAPVDDEQKAARWRVNWWTQVWHDDVCEGYPIMGLAERWMRENLPVVDMSDLVFVHSDYRTGNYLYDEDALNITAILDWELIHIGDFHEDLAWAAIKSWSTVDEDGTLLASGLMPVEELCEKYAAATGRRINQDNLYFYQVLGLYKCVAICLATSMNAARHSHNHQDSLLSWLGAAGHSFLLDLAKLLQERKA